ncbi:MAG: GNAT family N-acetyltransferase [Oscillospiraceae bacterium]|nr:GNAT family N-acetyltransferase [Oscillospiraceae bacterium]
MILETNRTILRPFTLSDAADLFSYAQDPRVGLSAGWTPHKTIEDSRNAIRTFFSSPVFFAVEDRESGHVIGSAGFVGPPSETTDELGFALNPAFWGRGIMPEAVRELLRYGFGRLGLETVWSICFAENRRCRRVLEKCGFMFMFQENLTGRVARDICFYMLLYQDWERRENGNG